ncbi:MAG TPA: FapA family protein [Bacillus bacterium]|nr:FapA family protein [Bacillus sp. (in: firmicutes)]
MDKKNIFKARTVEEAIALGLQQLGVTEEEVTIEILEEGRKGILSMGSREAVIRIITQSKEEVEVPSEEEIKEPLMEPIDEALAGKGKVWVENGEIHCIDSDEGELQVHIPSVVLFYKNNELVKEKTTISEKDKIKIECKDEEIATKWNIELSKDKLTAKINVIPGSKSTYILREQKPAREITLEVVKKSEPNRTLTTDEIYETLKKMQISYGIQEEWIDEACKAEKKAEFIIAEGDRPVEGKHGWLEYKVEISEGKKFKEREDGSIDFRAGRDIPSVGEGTEIAILHDPILGTDGKSVTGEIIPAKPVLPLQVRCGNGAELIEDRIIATSIGRPSIQKKGNMVVVNVVPKLEHQGDVGMASGNLKFNGDITISGNVEEHMEITATGNVEIRGVTSGAKIKAGQSTLHHRNVITSEIIAGNSDKVIVEKISELTEMLEGLEALGNDLNKLSQNPSFTDATMKDGIMPLLKKLIQSKYSPLVNLIRHFIITFRNDIEMVSADWRHLLKQIYDIFIMMDGKALQNLEEFNQLVEMMKQLVEYANTSVEIGVFVQLPSAMNSNIYSSGDVIIPKQGCYNCVIHAQGSIEINGFVRGGRIFAGKGAKLDEAGSKSGTPTLISVPHDQTITIKNAYSDTTIQIGKRRYKFTKNMTNIYAHIDEQGGIALR